MQEHLKNNRKTVSNLRVEKCVETSEENKNFLRKADFPTTWRDIYVCVCVLITQLCPTFCNPMDSSPPSFSSVHGILQARILECIAILFSNGSSQPSYWTLVSCIADRFFTIWATGKSWRGMASWKNRVWATAHFRLKKKKKERNWDWFGNIQAIVIPTHSH